MDAEISTFATGKKYELQESQCNISLAFIHKVWGGLSGKTEGLGISQLDLF